MPLKHAARYRSHKIVSAVQIGEGAKCINGAGDISLPIVDDGFETITVGADVVARYFPVPGDFLVQYEDGYLSISPRQPFLDGYERESISDYERIAKVCHEINRAYCAGIGDNSQPAWADAPEWQRTSAINGVKFSIENPDAPPSASHDSWSAEKRADGWAYGPVKDPALKQHPCLVPYDELPVEQRTKDYLFQAVVRSLT